MPDSGVICEDFIASQLLSPFSIPFFSPPSMSQEIRRGAELDARGIRAEERRLRDLATSLEVRSEEIRRREREGVRAREAALEAAKLEARQTLEVREEGVARER